jgi:hypothetical protein
MYNVRQAPRSQGCIASCNKDVAEDVVQMPEDRNRYDAGIFNSHIEALPP